MFYFKYIIHFLLLQKDNKNLFLLYNYNIHIIYFDYYFICAQGVLEGMA